MTCTTPTAHRLRRWAVASVLSAALLVPAACSGDDAPTPAASAPPTAAPARPDQKAAPVRVRLPRLKIDAALLPLQLGKKRELVPPPYGKAGWYQAGPEPGEIGRAVIAGHVDSKTGPDVFAALRNARRGDRIRVLLRDGSTVIFVVQKVETHPRRKFPTDRVYGTDGKHADLRLITCTGRYDRVRGRYPDNVIVFARMDALHSPATGLTR
ncbi:class F sortase, partial [Sporichthya brevicatena]|uniref:class F sortase n=1 Tax=Sporichthya brevicatena TaxID=171442 RepID=UPI0031DE161C